MAVGCKLATQADHYRVSMTAASPHAYRVKKYLRQEPELSAYLASWKEGAYQEEPLSSVLSQLQVEVDLLKGPFPYFLCHRYDWALARNVLSICVGLDAQMDDRAAVLTALLRLKSEREILIRSYLQTLNCPVLVTELGKVQLLWLHLADHVITYKRPKFDIPRLRSLSQALLPGQVLCLDTLLIASRDTPRRHSDTYTGLVSNNSTEFRFLVQRLLIFPVETISTIITSVFTHTDRCLDLDSIKRINAPSVSKKLYSAKELHIASNNQVLFDLIKGMVVSPRLKALLTPTTEAGATKLRIRINQGRISIPVAVREKVWRNQYGGNMDGHCYCCHTAISYTHWECGHIQAAAKGGSDVIENLRPVCFPCNRGMATMDMMDYIKRYNLPGPSASN